MKAKIVIALSLLLVCYSMGCISESNPEYGSEECVELTGPPYDYSDYIYDNGDGTLDVKPMFWVITNMPYEFAAERKTPEEFWALGYGDCDDKSYAFAHYLYYAVNPKAPIYIVHCVDYSSDIGHAYVSVQGEFYDPAMERLGPDNAEYMSELRSEGWDSFEFEVYEG